MSAAERVEHFLKTLANAGKNRGVAQGIARALGFAQRHHKFQKVSRRIAFERHHSFTGNRKTTVSTTALIPSPCHGQRDRDGAIAGG